MRHSPSFSVASPGPSKASVGIEPAPPIHGRSAQALERAIAHADTAVFGAGTELIVIIMHLSRGIQPLTLASSEKGILETQVSCIACAPSADFVLCRQDYNF